MATKLLFFLAMLLGSISAVILVPSCFMRRKRPFSRTGDTRLATLGLGIHSRTEKAATKPAGPQHQLKFSMMQQLVRFYLLVLKIPAGLLARFAFWDTLLRRLKLEYAFEQRCLYLQERLALSLDIYEYAAVYYLSTIFAGLLAFVLSHNLFAFALAMALSLILWRQFYAGQSKHREQRIKELLPELYRSLSISMASGKSLQQAFQYLGKQMPAWIGETFSKAAYDLRIGLALDQSLVNLEQSLGARNLDLLCSALAISQRTGCALKDLFEKASRSIRNSADLQRELRVKTSQAQLSSKIVSLLPLLLLLGMALLSPDFRAGIMTPLGMGCIILGLFLDLLGLMIIRSSLHIEI